MLFSVAKAIDRDRFLKLYRDVSFLTRLLFAPFGLDENAVLLLGDKGFKEVYSSVYQQLEDIISKCVFRCEGIDDDRIIATMHKFVSQNQDKTIVDEIKSGTEALQSLINPPPVVEFDFGNIVYDDIFKSQTLETVLVNVLGSLKKFKDLMDATNNTPKSVLHSNQDEQIQHIFGICIGTRLLNPISEMYTLSTQGLVEDLSPVINMMLNCLHVVVDVQTSDTVDEKIHQSINLSHSQYCSLLQLYTNDGMFSHTAKSHICMLDSKIDIELIDKLNIVDSLRSGKLFAELFMFQNPTLSFLLQLSRMYFTENSPLFVSSDMMAKAEDSLAFVLRSFERAQLAKQLAEEEKFSEAVTLLSDNLLDLLDGSNQDFEEQNSKLDLNSVPIVPVHLKINLLLQRSKYYSSLGEIELALHDIQQCIQMEPLCAEAYSIRSEIIFTGIHHFEDGVGGLEESPLGEFLTEEKRNDSINCLSQLFPMLTTESGENQFEENAKLDCIDVLLHQAAGDALLGFILGGSSDIALAAAAEEAARETCRKFARKVYEQRHTKQVEAASSNLLSVENMDSIDEKYFPRNWLIQSFFSGYEILSSALNLEGKSSLEETIGHTLSAGHDIDETDGDSPEEFAYKCPPDHLLMSVSDEPYLKEHDREGYHILKSLVAALEDLTLEGIDLSKSDKDEHLHIEDDSCNKDLVYRIPIQIFENENLDLKDYFPREMQLLLACGKACDEGFTLENACIRDQSSECDNSICENFDSVNHNINIEKNSGGSNEIFLQLVKLLIKSSNIIGVNMLRNGFVKSFSFHYDALTYPESVLKSKITSIRSESGNNGVGNKYENKMHGFDDGFSEEEEGEGEEEEDAYKYMQNAFAAHFGFTFEGKDDNDAPHGGHYAKHMEDREKLESTESEDDDVWKDVSDDDVDSNNSDDEGEGEWEDVSDDEESDKQPQIAKSNFSEENVTAIPKDIINTSTIPFATATTTNKEESQHDKSTKDISTVLFATATTTNKEESQHDKCTKDTCVNENDEAVVIVANGCSNNDDSFLKSQISNKIRARLLNICGSIVYLLGDSIGAIQCYEASLYFDTNLNDSRIKLGALLIDMDESNKAQYLLEVAAERDPSNPVISLHKGELYINQNDFDRAAMALRQANKSMNAGWSGSFNHDSSIVTEEFEEKASKSRCLVHSNIYALLGVSTLRQNPHRPEFALNILEEGLHSYPSSLILMLCQGEVHAQCGDMVKAIGLFAKAYSSRPDHPLALVNAGRTYQQLGQFHAAYSHITESLRVDNTFAMSYIDLAQLLRQQPSLSKESSREISNPTVAIEEAIPLAKQVSEIRDVLTARYVTLLQQSLKEKGLLQNIMI